MAFKNLKLNKHILKALSDKHYTSPTEVQDKVIPIALNKHDLIVTAQTGTGKTAAFALPIIQMLFDKQDASKKGKKTRALVLSPTRELAQQINDNFISYSQYSNLKTAIVYGGTPIEPQQKKLKDGVDILIATPGRLLDLIKRNDVKLNHIEHLIIDEADLMLDMGFIDDILKIERLCPDSKQTSLFSATMPNKVVSLGESILKSPKNIVISTVTNISNLISQKLYYVPISKKMQLCLHLIKSEVKSKVIIFRRTKFGVEKLEEYLQKQDIQVTSLHGSKTQSLRREALNTFKNSGVNILIATDVAARGIDINQLDIVINFDLPTSPETYVHRIGRTGRAGHSGKAYTFCSAEEKQLVSPIQNLIKQIIPVEEEHPFPLSPDAKPTIHKKKGSKYKKGRKSEASKKKKKRWY